MVVATKIFGRLAAVLCLLAAAPLAAQGGGVTGTVLNADNGQPVRAVNVTLTSADDANRVLRTLSGADGTFRVPSVTPGTYTLQVTSLGFAMHRRVGLVIPAAGLNLGTIRMASATLVLEGVQARAERSAVIVAPDRTIYSTRDMPVAAGGMATDVLRSVPELEVDINGGVQLRGTSAQVYLNGRPAPMQGASLELFLQQFPADRIERIEVIPNPSARFEAEGAGGIVNIVLKQDVDLGLSGNLFVNGGTRGEAGAGGRLTYQSGPVTLFGGGFLRRSDRRTDNFDLRRNLAADPDFFTEQDGYSDREGLSGNLDLTAELALTPRAAAWGSLGAWRNGFDAAGVSLFTQTDTLGGLLERYARTSEDERRSLSTNLSAGFRYTLSPVRRAAESREGRPGPGGAPGGPGGGGGRGPGGGGGGMSGGPGGGGGGGGTSAGASPGTHELKVEVGYDNRSEDALSNVRREFLDAEEESLGLPVQLTLDDADSGETEREVKVDYVRPWGTTGSIEIGYRGEVRDTDDARRLELVADQGDPTSMAETSSGFDFRETFHSAFGTLSRTLGKLSVQAGLRAERSDTRLELSETPDVFENDYLSLFPSANLRYDLGDGRELRAQYSRRVRRPRPSFLNPVDRSNDPLNRVVGNPELEPQYSQSFGLEGSWTATFGSVRVAPYYRRTDNDWVQTRRVDNAGVSTQTWENLATVSQLGSSATVSVRPIGGVGGSLSLSAAHEVREADNLAVGYSGSATWWSANGNVSARVSDRLALQGMFFYRPARDVAQGRVSSSLMTHVGIRQQIGERGTLNLMVTDPFDLYRSSFENRDPTFEQIGRSTFVARSAVLSFSYSFGRPPRVRNPRQEEQGEAEEMPTP